MVMWLNPHERKEGTIHRTALTRWGVPLLAALTITAFSASCRHRRGSSTEVRTLRVSGAWALYPLMQRWAEAYMRQNPGLRIEVSAGGAGKGMTDCLSDLVDLAMVSRDLRPEERSKGAFPLPVARDAVFAVVSARHPLAPDLRRTGLQRRQLLDIFRSEKPGPFRVYTRSDACGAAEVWALYLGGRQEDLRGNAVFGDPGIAEAIRRDSQAIGYNNLAFAFDPRTGQPVDGLMVVALDCNENGRVDPEEDVSTRDKALAAIASGRYPAPPARDLFLVTQGDPKPSVRPFLRWILKEGQSLATECGFVPIGARGREALASLAK